MAPARGRTTRKTTQNTQRTVRLRASLFFASANFGFVLEGKELGP